MGERTERYLPEKDIEYICYAMNSHIEMLQDGHSAPLNGSVKEEQAVNCSLVEKLDRDIPLSSEEYWDLYYVMSERADMVAEGIGIPFKGFSGANDAGKTSRILRKLGKLLGINPGSEIYPQLEYNSDCEIETGYS